MVYSSGGVSIPQAVSTIAIPAQFFVNLLNSSFNTASGKHYCNKIDLVSLAKYFVSFNTASGKHYCNLVNWYYSAKGMQLVSIPQAVSTIAINNFVLL